MRQILDHIYRAQMAHSCNDGDKLRVELESAAKRLESKLTIDNTERVKLFCTTNHACKFKGIKKQCTYRCIYAEPKGKQDKA